MLRLPMRAQPRAEHETGRPPLRVAVRAHVADALLAASLRAAPCEIGALLTGRRDGDTLHVEDAAMLDNIAIDPEQRFAADELQFLRSLSEHEARGLAFLGFAHSHPHGSASPSTTDIRDAWHSTLLILVAPHAEEGARIHAHWRDRSFCVALALLPAEALA